MRMDENDGDQVVTGQGSMEELDYEASDNNVEEESMEQPSENDSIQQSENNNFDLENGVRCEKAETVVNGETKSEVAESMESQAGISVGVPDHSKDIQAVKADSRDKISRRESGDKKASMTNGSTKSSERRTNSTRHHHTRTDHKARGRRKGDNGPLPKPGEGERSRGRNRSRSPVRVRLSNYYEVDSVGDCDIRGIHLRRLESRGKSSSKHSERKREGSCKKTEEKDTKQKEVNEKTSVLAKGQMEINIEKGNCSELNEESNNNDKSSSNGGGEEDHRLKPQDLSEELNKDNGDHNILTGDGS